LNETGRGIADSVFIELRQKKRGIKPKTCQFSLSFSGTSAPSFGPAGPAVPFLGSFLNDNLASSDVFGMNPLTAQKWNTRGRYFPTKWNILILRELRLLLYNLFENVAPRTPYLRSSVEAFSTGIMLLICSFKSCHFVQGSGIDEGKIDALAEKLCQADFLFSDISMIAGEDLRTIGFPVGSVAKFMAAKAKMKPVGESQIKPVDEGLSSNPQVYRKQAKALNPLTGTKPRGGRVSKTPERTLVLQKALELIKPFCKDE
jgi:hypothetical protein